MKILILLLFLSNAFLLAESEYVVVNFPEPSQKLVEYVVDNNYDIIMLKENEFLHVIMNSGYLSQFERLGWQPEVLYTETEMRNNLRLKTRELPGYRNYMMVVNELTTIAEDNPGIANLYNIGDSQGKEYYNAGNNNYEDYSHDIWAVKITADPESEHDRPAVYYNGAQHAREPISTEVTMHILWHLTDNYGTDPEITFLVDNTEIWFIPVMNPDGHKIVIDQTDLWWRKNIRDNTNNGYIHSHDGVDLNRNYSYEWQYNPSYWQQTYTGPYPSSEPETTALRDLWQERHFVAGISYHSHGQLVLFPPGYTWNLISPDVQTQSALATAMAETIPRINEPGYYTAQHSWQLYPATGTCEDDSYCNHGIFAYTFELANMFIPPPDQVDQICEDNLEAALILLRRVHHSTLTGHITDYSTNEPVTAEVFIPGIDDTGVWRAPYESSEEYGRYYRLLLPDTYEVQFTAPGYLTSPLISFSINDSTQTVLDYELLPLEYTIPEITNIFGTDEFIGMIWEVSYPEFSPDGYRIYRNEELLNPDSLLTLNAYFDQDIITGHTYSYRISAVYTELESDLSPAMTFTPSEGTLLAADDVLISISAETVNLAWSSIDDVTEYLIFSTLNPYTDDWIFLDFTTETEWSEIRDEPRHFYQIRGLTNQVTE